MHGIWFKYSNKPSTEAELVITELLVGTSRYVSSLTRADLTMFMAGDFPVDGWAMSAVKLQIPCLLFAKGWTVDWYKRRPNVANSGQSMNGTLVPT